MNKPEPLKDKCIDIDHPKECQEGCTFSEQDILLAIEWLKSKVTHTYGCEKQMGDSGICRCDYNERIELINKAFQDVIKK
ncbi:hypothetical protein LCGC14_3005750 [marine sediment metagenome]|uniref:Uncharacterized protein n=1 Tax=marine sediment metagenome TaxID=412755 RepID=A0A0F8WZJ8_9ZZZZ